MQCHHFQAPFEYDAQLVLLWHCVKPLPPRLEDLLCNTDQG